MKEEAEGKGSKRDGRTPQRGIEEKEGTKQERGKGKRSEEREVL